MGWSEVEQAFNEAVARGVFPGATVAVRVGKDIAFEGAFGFRSLVPERTPMAIDTVFDLSSLTKALATTTAAMVLARDNKFRLEDKVTRFFPDFAVHGKSGVTFRHLLAHCSGLAAWRPFHERIAAIEKGGKVNFVASHGAKEFAYAEIHRERLEASPGTKAIYSDLNFMLLGEMVEKATAGPLNRFCRDRIVRPLGLLATDFIDIAMARARRLKPVTDMFAATEISGARGRLLAGEVDDENAFSMGGVAGHAGLFGPVREVDRIVRELIACWNGRSDFLPKKVVRQFWARDGTVTDSSWALGWDTPSSQGSSSGRHFSPEAVGHLGFTGTSIWIEPAREIAISLMTNRVHPRRDNHLIREFRPQIHDLIMEAIGNVSD